MTVYLTRSEVAERYPISIHTLARLASIGTGPVFYKPTDKALYKVEDIERWIDSAAVCPEAAPHNTRGGRGRGRQTGQQSSGRPMTSSDSATSGRRLKSLPPSPNSYLLRAENRRELPEFSESDRDP